MADGIYVAITLLFFGLCALYVSWCDRIIGPDPEPLAGPADVEARTDNAVAEVAP